MSVSPDQIFEPSTLPARSILFWGVAVSFVVGALLVAAVLAFPSSFSFGNIFPFILALMIAWVVPLLARMAVVGSLPDQYDHLVPSAVKRRLWIYGAWKFGALGVFLLALIGLGVAWVTGIPPKPFGVAFVTSAIMSVIGSLVVSTIVDVAIIQQHWSSRNRP